MDPGTLEGEKITSAESTRTIVTSQIPRDIIDEILDFLSTDSDFRLSLLSCSLISKPWILPCRRRLFHTISFTGKDMIKWLKTFPLPQQSPAHHVRDLTLSLGGCSSAPEDFFIYTQWFTDVEKMTVLGLQGFQPVWIPSSGKLPQSVTSLTIDTDIVTLLDIRDVMQQLPNLNDFTLSGRLHRPDEESLRGIGTVLKAGFNGRLRLFRLRKYAEMDVMGMLLEVPTGLHFTEVHIVSVLGCLHPAVRFTEACGKSLVKLTYSVEMFGSESEEDLSRFFDFSKLPNLQEVTIRFRWVNGSLLWVSKALSTIKPATSPRLSAIELNFSGRPPRNTPVRLREELGNDIRLIDRHVVRIRRQFMGVVNLTVHRHREYEQLV